MLKLKVRGHLIEVRWFHFSSFMPSIQCVYSCVKTFGFTIMKKINNCVKHDFGIANIVVEVTPHIN